MNADPPSLPAGGGVVTLTASCAAGSAPTTYVWTGGFAAGKTTAQVPGTLSTTTTFTVVASDARGSGNQATVTVVVGADPPSACTVSANPPSLPAGGGTVTLTAICAAGGTPTSYAWTGGFAAGKTTGTVSGTVTTTTIFTVVASNADGSANPTIVTVVVAPASATTLLFNAATWQGNRWCYNNNHGAWFPTVSSDGKTATFIDSLGDYCYDEIRTIAGAQPQQTYVFEVNPELISGGVNYDEGWFGFGPSWYSCCAQDIAYDGWFSGIVLRGGKISTAQFRGYPDGNIEEDIGTYQRGQWLTVRMTIVTGGVQVSIGNVTRLVPWLGQTDQTAKRFIAIESNSADGLQLRNVSVTPSAAAPSSCAVTANPPSLPAGGGTVTLTAVCVAGGAPASYAWTGGFAAGRTTAAVSGTVSSTTTFAVTPSNASGSGNTASVTVVVESASATTLLFNAATWQGNRWCYNNNHGAWFPTVSSDGKTATFIDSLGDYCYDEIRTIAVAQPQQTYVFEVNPLLNSGGLHVDEAYFGFGPTWYSCCALDIAYDGWFSGIVLKNGKILTAQYRGYPNGNIEQEIGTYQSGQWLTVRMTVVTGGVQVSIGNVAKLVPWYGQNDQTTKRFLVIEGDSADGFQLRSVTASAATGSTYSRNYVQKAYVAYYGRPADPDGLGYWATRMDAEGGSLNAIIGAFGYSDEFYRRYGGLSYAALVTKIYQQALGRDPDPGGLNWYVNELLAGRRTLQSITLDVLNGATTAPDSIVVANKLDVAAYYSAKVAAGCPYGTEQNGVNALSGVTAGSATVTAAKAAIDSRCGP